VEGSFKGERSDGAVGSRDTASERRTHSERVNGP